MRKYVAVGDIIVVDNVKYKCVLSTDGCKGCKGTWFCASLASKRADVIFKEVENEKVCRCR